MFLAGDRQPLLATGFSRFLPKRLFFRALYPPGHGSGQGFASRLPGDVLGSATPVLLDFSDRELIRQLELMRR